MAASLDDLGRSGKSMTSLVSWDAMSALDVTETRYRLVRDGFGRWRFQRCGSVWPTVGAVVVLMSTAVSLAYVTGVFDVRSTWDLRNTTIMLLPATLLPLLISLVAVLGYIQSTVAAVVDARQLCIWGPRTKDREPWSVPFHEVHAFQVLRRDDETDVAECNIVLKTGRRVHVFTQPGAKQVAHEARRVAAQVDVPVYEGVGAPVEAERGSGQDAPAQGRAARVVHGGLRYWTDLLSPSGRALVLANLGPLVSVVFWDWSVFVVFSIYWFECLIVGAIGVLRLVLAMPTSAASWRVKALGVPFFVVHFGVFLWMQALSVISVYGHPTTFRNAWDLTPLLVLLGDSAVVYLIVPFAVSHGVSLILNYIKRQEYARSDLTMLMVAPYYRVGVMHLALIVGGPFVLLLARGSAGLVILITIKLFGDLVIHRFEHRRVLVAGVPAGSGSSGVPGTPAGRQA